MCQANTQERIVVLLATLTRRDPGTIAVTTTLYDDLAMDSLDMADLCLSLEDEFGIEISIEREAALTNVQDVFALVQELHG